MKYFHFLNTGMLASSRKMKTIKSQFQKAEYIDLIQMSMFVLTQLAIELVGFHNSGEVLANNSVKVSVHCCCCYCSWYSQLLLLLQKEILSADTCKFIFLKAHLPALTERYRL